MPPPPNGSAEMPHQIPGIPSMQMAHNRALEPQAARSDRGMASLANDEMDDAKSAAYWPP
jgi:hypothetical protein